MTMTEQQARETAEKLNHMRATRLLVEMVGKSAEEKHGLVLAMLDETRTEAVADTTALLAREGERVGMGTPSDEERAKLTQHEFREAAMNGTGFNVVKAMADEFARVRASALAPLISAGLCHADGTARTVLGLFDNQCYEKIMAAATFIFDEYRSDNEDGDPIGDARVRRIYNGLIDAASVLVPCESCGKTEADHRLGRRTL